MIYAQILDGLVVNTIICGKHTDLPTFAEGFDYFIRIDTITPIPGVSWTYDGANFIPPIIPDPVQEDEDI